MPELPELEIVREVVERRLAGRMVSHVDVIPPGGPIVVRDLSGAGFAATLTGARVDAVRRRGKFIVLELDSGRGVLAINPKLTGRLQLAAAGERRRAGTCVVLGFAGGPELRYVDPRKMGQVYLASSTAQVGELAVDVADALAIERETFHRRLRGFRGEIKGILTRGGLVAGIGNAYADEILWNARVHPFRKRTTLSTAEVDRLYDAMRSTLVEAIERLRADMGEDVSLKPRDSLAVHMKPGAPCPRCGTPVSIVGANQRITNFCRTCQPGGLLRGM